MDDNESFWNFPCGMHLPGSNWDSDVHKSNWDSDADKSNWDSDAMNDLRDPGRFITYNQLRSIDNDCDG